MKKNKKKNKEDIYEICIEEDVEEIAFEDPVDLSEFAIASFSFADEEELENEKTKSHKDLVLISLDSLNYPPKAFGATPPIEGEELIIKRSYSLRLSTIKKLQEIKAKHPATIHINTLVDLAISHYYECIK